MHLPYGEHTLTIIAKDTAMNSTEHRVHFSLVEEKKSFSIFSNKEVLFRKDGNVMPLYCTAIGNVISKNWSCIISDNMGKVHYEDSVNFLTAGYCKGFKWDGNSQTTNERVPLGIYTLSISCSDSLGGTYTQRQEFVVNEDAVNSYLVQEADYSKQLSVDSLPLRYSFKDGKFYFAMKGYQGKVEGAKLKIKKGNEVFFECEVEDAQNIVWDGCKQDGTSILFTGEKYSAEIELEDEEEKVFATEVKVPLILGEWEGNRRRVIVDSIHFPGYEVDVLKAKQYFTSNGQNLKKTADAVLESLKDGNVLVIVGNANYTTYPDAKKMKSEDELLNDISLKRAEMIKLIFMFYGVSEKQIKVEGNGGKNFVVLPTAKDNWKNRRVEFFIEGRTEEKNEEKVESVNELLEDKTKEDDEMQEDIDEESDDEMQEDINEESDDEIEENMNKESDDEMEKDINEESDNEIEKDIDEESDDEMEEDIDEKSKDEENDEEI